MIDIQSSPKTVAQVLIAKASEIGAAKFCIERLRAALCAARDRNAALEAEIEHLACLIQDLHREIGRLTRQLIEEGGSKHQGPPDRLTAAVAMQWVRLGREYKKRQRQKSTPRQKGSRL